MSQDPHGPLRPSGERHLLVADDDPSTRQFLAGALAAHGYIVALAQDGTEALEMAQSRRFDALLLDCRMPRAGAMEVLKALRADPAAASNAATALATSAEVPAPLRASLLSAGFAGVIEKPCRVASLVDALAATLGLDDGTRILDDAAGLTATGDPHTMQALRQLLRAELVDLSGALGSLVDDPAELVERLHRLRSACGFCGAARLGAQAKVLQGHVRETRIVVPDALARFRAELDATLAALSATG
ncbi:hybrid sensor histidine kinase/response regulator [Luteibacter sp. SG786]|uniref:response regulator n=1 Tax=Luteibacter sp. SG786 TaxID=2587130 RepID=UPI0014235EA9|nr:hybrid sensor histidine kinase/response regulator [Luteibacter sp. SG786]NII54788.1 CheY-like chemotaxis protein [Luteibacter sp. SG786]